MGAGVRDRGKVALILLLSRMSGMSLMSALTIFAILCRKFCRGDVSRVNGVKPNMSPESPIEGRLSRDVIALAVPDLSCLLRNQVCFEAMQSHSAILLEIIFGDSQNNVMRPCACGNIEPCGRRQTNLVS